MIRKEYGNNVRVCCMTTDFESYDEVMSIGVGDVDFGHEMTFDETLSSMKHTADQQKLTDTQRIERCEEVIFDYAKGKRMIYVCDNKADFEKAVILRFGK